MIYTTKQAEITKEEMKYMKEKGIKSGDTNIIFDPPENLGDNKWAYNIQVIYFKTEELIYTKRVEFEIK